MRNNFQACLKTVFANEGGYVNDPRDPGGATNMGITIATLSQYLEKEVTPDDVKKLTADVAGAIYRDKYWEPLCCDDLPVGVDLSVFDMGVNAGITRAAKILQGIVDATPDGIIGPKTLAGVSKYCTNYGSSSLVLFYKVARDAFYRSIKGFQYYGTGWLNRSSRVAKESELMILENK